MRILKLALFQNVLRYCSLQVPDIIVGDPPDDEKNVVDLPDDYFERLTCEGGLPSPQGFLFISRKGYEALKGEILEELKSTTNTWETFETKVEKHFASRRNKIQKEILKLEKKLRILKEST